MERWWPHCQSRSPAATFFPCLEPAGQTDAVLHQQRPRHFGFVLAAADGQLVAAAGHPVVVAARPDGESIFRYIYTDIQKELTVKLRQSIEVYQSVKLTEESRMALGQWLEQWLKNIAPNIRPSTLRRYEGTVRNHIVPFMGDKPITQITGKDIKKLYDTLARQGNRTTGECLPAVLSVGFTPCSMKHWGRQNKF
mgnify:CR=1 FL=1